MDQFPHLNFVQVIQGKPRFFGGGSTHDISEYNKNNRHIHSSNLVNQTGFIEKSWDDYLKNRRDESLPKLDPSIVPIFFQINEDLIGSEFDLANLGIEIISQEDNGFIIGASTDALRSLKQKINDFNASTHGSAIVADLWQIVTGDRSNWRKEHILTPELLAKWQDINDADTLEVEVSIAFDKPLGKEPDPTKRGGEKRLARYRDLQIAKDEELLERENNFEQFIANYGQILTSYIHLEDSFSCQISISGKGLKDFVENYPFVFEVSEGDQIEDPTGEDIEGHADDFEILAPDENSIEVGVIDSGIMEDHKYLQPAIKQKNSKCYIHGETSTADNVSGGGHGTRVAGAILYPQGISLVPVPYQLPCYLRNLRVLDKNNYLVTKYPADLIKHIVDDNEDIQIFNHSICSIIEFRKKHMSTWGATLDSIIHGKNVLFIVSAGNISKGSIRSYLIAGENYPDYLQNNSCRIANPAQSSFALTVGSINHEDFEDADWISVGNKNQVSAYSRIGLGIWGSIKPEVVEYGGGIIVAKNDPNRIRDAEQTCTELLRSTLGGGPAYGKDRTGTSFSTPKITSIAARLKQLYPAENINLIRALIIQGARLPQQFLTSPTLAVMQQLGYGIPIIERVTTNSEHRISFYNTGEIHSEEGHIYSLKIPDHLRDPGNEYDILIEVTLCYTAKVRRTRQKTKSYLSTWLDWTSSKLDETHESFKNFILKEVEGTVNEYDKDARRKLSTIPWKLGDRTDRGEVDGLRRNDSTAQKDWAIIKSYQLPKELGFAVNAHKGWEINEDEIPYAIVVSLEILGANVPIYEDIKVENEVEQLV